MLAAISWCRWRPPAPTATSRWWSPSAPPPPTAMVVCRSEICATIVRDLLDRGHRRRRVALDRQHPLGDVLGRLRRLLRQLLHLVGHDREALARLAGPGRLDRRVQRQQVGLLGDRGDHLDHVADLRRGLAQLGDRRRRRARPRSPHGPPPRWPPPRSTRSPGSRHPSAPHPRRRSARCATPPRPRRTRHRTAATVSCADAEICADDADSSSALAATASAEAAISPTVAAIVAAALFSATAIWPTSSRPRTGSRTARSPAARRSRPLRTPWMPRTMPRETTKATSRPSRMASAVTTRGDGLGERRPRPSACCLALVARASTDFTSSVIAWSST